MNMIFSLISIHYFKYLQLKFDFNQKIPINANKALKIPNRPENRPTFNMYNQMSYVGSRKSVEAVGGIFFFFAECIWDGTRQCAEFAECPYEALGELLSVPSVCG